MAADPATYGPNWDVGCLFCVKGVPGKMGSLTSINVEQPGRLCAGRLEGKLAPDLEHRPAMGIRRPAQRQPRKTYPGVAGSNGRTGRCALSFLDGPSQVSSNTLCRAISPTSGMGRLLLVWASQPTRTQSRGTPLTAISLRDSGSRGSLVGRKARRARRRRHLLRSHRRGQHRARLRAGLSLRHNVRLLPSKQSLDGGHVDAVHIL